MAVRVSVAMCTYQGARFVREQVATILAQSVPVDELVVADDGSRDGTLDLVRDAVEHAEQQLALRVLAPGPVPLGVTGNFERALLATSGAFVALSDQDDRWRPDRIAAGLDALGDDRVLLAHADAALIDADGAALGPTLFDSIGVRDAEIDLVDSGRALEVLLRRNIVTGATAMLRAELIRTAAPFPSEWVHDEWLAVVAAVTGRMATSRRVVADYRLHGENQIGVTLPSMRMRLGRMLEPRGGRLERIRSTMTVLADRLPSLGASARTIELVQGKVAFETARAAYPRRRVARLAPIGANAGRYARYSSQGRVDLVRDLVQPA